MIKLAIFTCARSDFGVLKNLIERLNKDKRFNPNLIVGSAHTSNIFGNTKKEFENIKIKKFFFNFKYSQSDEYNILKNAEGILKNSNIILNNIKFDGAIILGDRYEMMCFALCCLFYKIPIIHLSGGSDTKGSIDDVFRLSISKMSKIHLLETNFHKKKLTKVGINKNLFVVGAPALENIKFKFNKKKLTFKESQFLSGSSKKIMACFHPETTIPLKENIKNLKILINFLNNQNHKVIFTFPNADEGFREFIKIIKIKLKKTNSLIVPNLGVEKYHYFLRNSDLLIGNSSSGIVESCSFKIPCINLGKRQEGRYAPKNVLHCSFDKKKIESKFKKSMSKKFLIKIKKIKNPYEKLNISSNICNIIYSQLKNV